MKSSTLSKKSNRLSYVDFTGKRLTFTRNRRGTYLTLYHDKIEEGPERKEIEYFSVEVTKDSSKESAEIFNAISNLYESVGEEVIISKEPITDGRNHFLLRQFEGAYALTVGHDLAYSLNPLTETNIKLPERLSNQLDFEGYSFGETSVVQDKGIQLVKSKRLN